MKISQRIICHFLLLIGLVSSLAFAQSNVVDTYTIVEGRVVVTPAWCIDPPCESTTATIEGTFTADITADRLLFPSSNIVTNPDVNFQLPTDPEEDAGGVMREVSFEIAGDVLIVKGSVDSRAFDGPLIEYKFVARLGVSPGGSFFTAEPDIAACAPPFCGGYYIKSVNKKYTRCANGRMQRKCYVADVVFKNSPLRHASSFNNATPLLLQGSIEPYGDGAFSGFGKFTATAAYRSATDQTAYGRFYGLEHNGTVCITSPCFSYDEDLLNVVRPVVKVSDVDLEMSGASAGDIQQARTILARGDKLYSAGKNHKYRGFAGTGLRFVAHQFYLPLEFASICSEGYATVNGFCQTPFGCTFPLLEQTVYGGAPRIDPITGEIGGTVTKSCVERCDESAGVVNQAPGYCSVYLP